MPDDSLLRPLIGTAVLVLVLSALFVGYAGQCTTGSQVTSRGDIPSVRISGTPAVDSDLLNSSYWRIVESQFAITINELIPQTILGFINSSEYWKQWAAQDLPSLPLWIDMGVEPYLDASTIQLASESLSSGNATKATLLVQQYADTIAGLSLAALDFVTFNGLSAIQTYVSTGNIAGAFCTTSPSQLGQLYGASFNPSTAQDIRARYLGTAIAFTSVIVLLAGAGGFDSDFQIALDNTGLSDAWSTVKSQLASIDLISDQASEATMGILAKLATRFPQESTWTVDLTSDRIDSMVQVLHDSRVPDAEIDQDIGNLALAADSAQGPADVANDADLTSYEQGGGIMVSVGSQNRLFLYSNDGSTQWIQASFLESVVPGFTEGESIPLKITYEGRGITTYHLYQGGDAWIPTIPDDVAQPGGTMTISIQVLSIQDFVESLPSIDFVDAEGFSYLADASTLTGYSISGNQLKMSFIQDPPFEDENQFSVTGQTATSLGFGSSSGVYLDVHITDIFDDARTLRIYFDGYNRPSLGISVGNDFGSVELVSFDGVRLVIAYERAFGDFRTATFYPTPPSVLYSLSEMQEYSLPYLVRGYSESFEIESVTPLRSLEQVIAHQGDKNEVSRIGAEIAYTVATERLGLENVVMEDPSQPGADLYTLDGKTVIEARFLQRTQTETGTALSGDLQKQLTQMVGKLNSDFRASKTANNGYAILSYLNGQGAIQTIILEVTTLN